MLKKSSALLLSFLLLLIVLPFAVHAENATSSANDNERKPEKIFRLGPTIKSELKDYHASMGAMRETMKIDMQAFKEQMQKKREDLKTKLQTFRDEHKKELISRFDTKLSSVSAKRASQMANAVTRLEEVLVKIETKAATAKSGGADTTALDKAIVDAHTALDAASAAVTTQSGKEYVLTVTDETTARQSISTTVKQLETDLRATHALVKAAKDAVWNAAMELRKLTHPGEKSASGSATVSPTVIVLPTVPVSPTVEVTVTLTVTPTP